MFCLFPAFDYFRVPLPVIADLLSVLSSATISNSNTNSIPLANIVVMSRLLTHSLSPSPSLSMSLALHLKFNLEIEFDCFEFAAAAEASSAAASFSSSSSSASLVCLPFCVYIEIISSIYAHLFIDGSHSPCRAFLIQFSFGRRK